MNTSGLFQSSVNLFKNCIGELPIQTAGKPFVLVANDFPTVLDGGMRSGLLDLNNV